MMYPSCSANAILPPPLLAWFTPAEANEALTFILARLREPGEVRMFAFTFTHPLVYQALCDRHAAKQPSRILADYSQSQTADSLPLLKNLHRLGIETTLCSSPLCRDQCQHRKAMILPAVVIEMSANFTQRGFCQTNTVLAINNPEYHAKSVAHWNLCYTAAKKLCADWQF